MGFADLLLADQGLSAKQREWLTIITSSSKFMTEIVNDIVEITRNETKGDEIELVPISVDSLVRISIVGMEQRARKKGVALELVHQAESEVTMSGERNKFTRIINNLLSNAIKFTPRGGTVTVTIGKDEQHVTLKVCDTGTGISEQMLSTLFDRFTKASRPGTDGEPGTGLGMSITKQLVDLHHGTIQVESAPGKGTGFYITFPLMR
jgi:signal transduction histidine kinase